MVRPLLVALAAASLSFGPLAAGAASGITAAGSTALLPLVKAGAAEYQAKHPGVQISVTGGGSGVGIAQVAAKAVTLGDSDIVAKGRPELVDHKVAVIGFAIATNADSGVTQLTKTQVRDIFAGKVTNWKQVGGADLDITVVNRPRSSGTRAVFTSVIMGGTPIAETGLTEDATGTVVTTVKTTPGAIAYAALSGTRDKGLTLLSLDGVEPTDENIESGKYPIWSYEHIYTNGKPDKSAADFLAFLAGNLGTLHKLGYIGLREMKVSEAGR